MQCVGWCCAVCELWCNWARPAPGLEGTDTKAPREKSGEGAALPEEEEEEVEGIWRPTRGGGGGAVVFLGIAEEEDK